MKGDFHIHSSYSDGELSPKEIVILAKRVGLDVISISDHNTVDGVEEAIKESKKVNIKVVPAIELSTRYKGNRVHILGYFNSKIYKNKKFLNGLKLLKLRKINEFKNKIFNEKVISKKKSKISLEDGIKFLKMFNGKVILAHPVCLRKRILNEVLKFDFDGIEAIHSRNTIKDTKYFLNLAEENGYIYTAGSDFHKLFDSHDKHGMIGNVYLELKNIDKLFGF